MFKSSTYFKLTTFALFVTILLYACKRDYIIGGEAQDTELYKGMTTYDVLKKFHEFDTLIQVIDAGDLKEVINQSNSTFFAVNNRTVFNYLNARTIFLQNTVDQTKKFLLDSLLYYVRTNKDKTRDSLLMYLIPNLQVSPDNLTSIGKIYPSGLSGSNAIVSFEEALDVNDGNSPLTSTIPRIVYFTQLWKPYQIGSDSTAADVPARTGIRARIKTSFIKTMNGVVNIPATSTLFFYGMRLN